MALLMTLADRLKKPCVHVAHSSIALPWPPGEQPKLAFAISGRGVCRVGQLAKWCAEFRSSVLTASRATRSLERAARRYLIGGLLSSLDTRIRVTASPSEKVYPEDD